MARPRKHWNYIVCDNDEYELTRLSTDDIGEVAKFLGVSIQGLAVHFCRGSMAAGSRAERYRYKVLRFEERSRE